MRDEPYPNETPFFPENVHGDAPRHTSPSTHESIVEVGSRWYAWGEHWEVVGKTTHNGEPGVALKLLRGKSKTLYTKTNRLLLKAGTRQEVSDA